MPYTALSLFKMTFLMMLVCLQVSCSKDMEPILVDDPMDGGDPMENIDPLCPTEDCASEYLPIVFVHGFLGSGDTYNNHVRRFIANDYPKEYLQLFDYNSVSTGDAVADLDVFIDNLLAQTRKTKVNLVGHSAGGGVGYNYLSDSLRANKIGFYGHIGSNANDTLPGPDLTFPTVNIYSTDDLIVAGADIPGATNVQLTGQDHYQVATSVECFTALFGFFNEDMTPTRTEPMATSTIQLGGVVKTFAENQADAGVLVDIYDLDADGFRSGTEPKISFTTDADGNWGPFSALSSENYEFHLTKVTDSGFRSLHYYHSKTESDKCNIYLRSFPPAGSFAGSFLSAIPQDDASAVVIVFSSSKAVISGRDELSIGDISLSTDDLASADQTAIAFFAYDNGDAVTSGEKLGNFALFPFLNGIDLFVDTATPTSIPVTLNDEVVAVPNWRSGAEGPAVIIFE